MARKLIAKTLIAQGTSTVNASGARCVANIAMFNEITSYLTSSGFKRVDTNGDHSGKTGGYLYASFVPAGSSDTSSYYFTIKTTTTIDSSSNNGIACGLTSTVPTDGTNQSLSPSASWSFGYSDTTVGERYIRKITFNMNLLENEDVALFGSGADRLYLRMGVIKSTHKGIVDLYNSGIIYRTNGEIEYLASAYSSASTPIMDDEYASSQKRSKVYVVPAGFGASSSTSGINYDDVLPEVLNVAGGLMRTNGDILRLYINGHWQRYVIMYDRAFLFAIDD